MKSRMTSVVLLACLGLATALQAQETQPDSAKAILDEAAAASLKVKNVSYAFTFEFILPQFESPVNYAGEARIIRGADADSAHMYLKGTFSGPESVMPEPYDIIAGTDTKTAYLADGSSKRFIHGPHDEAKDYLISAGSFGIIQAFVMPHPFSEEMGATFTGSKDPEEVNGVLCDVLTFDLMNGMAQTTLYLGQKDRLPRRIEKRIGMEGEQNITILTISQLNPDAGLKKEEFAMKVPEGYTPEEFEEPNPMGDTPALLAVGDAAPEFALESAGGDTVNLEDLRGNIVVLDFWATWCGPCKLAMPGVQKLHEHFAGKPVKVFGVNCWEQNPDDAVAYMKDKEYTYGLLLEGDKVAEAYKVSGIPTFYVIGADGNIIQATVGYDEEGEKKLVKFIEAELEKMDQ